MDCPSIGLPGPFDFSAPHDLWFVALLPPGVLILGGIFFFLKRCWERRFHRYPAQQSPLFFRGKIRISEALYLFGILVWGIALLWIDAIYREEKNTSGWGFDCFEAFRQTENPVLLYAWIGWSIGLLLCLFSLCMLYYKDKGRASWRFIRQSLTRR